MHGNIQGLVIMIVVVWRRSRHSQFLLAEVHDFFLLFDAPPVAAIARRIIDL
jgi:hypothetical protein